MRKEALYNNIRKTGYPECTDYLEGLEIVSCDYKEVFNRYKDIPGVVFLVDPPYLSTDVGTYNMYWNMADYLDVLNVLKEMCIRDRIYAHRLTWYVKSSTA